jgi:hypothetical protein
MSVNRYQPHVLVLPEDDANRQLANGFIQDQDVSTRRIQVLEPAGGWMRVLECFTSDHVRAMETCQLRSMVLLIDFDGKKDRMNLAKEVIPSHLTERVFVLGVLTEPEDLRKASLGSYETIGRAMAKDLPRGNRYDLGTRSPATQCRRDWPSTRQRSAVLV